MYATMQAAIVQVGGCQCARAGGGVPAALTLVLDADVLPALGWMLRYVMLRVAPNWALSGSLLLSMVVWLMVVVRGQDAINHECMVLSNLQLSYSLQISYSATCVV